MHNASSVRMSSVARPPAQDEEPRSTKIAFHNPAILGLTCDGLSLSLFEAWRRMFDMGLSGNLILNVRI